MNTLFNRTVEIDIGDPDSGEGVRITDLRVAFKVHKTKSSEANTCEIQIYNLGEDTRNSITKLDTICIVRAGYLEAGGPIEVFRGFVSEVTSQIKPPNKVVKITVDDGSVYLRDTKTTVSYEEGTSIKSVASDLLDTFKAPKSIKDAVNNFTDKKFLNGLSFSGKSKDLMDQLARTSGVEWSIQNNEIKILKENEPDSSFAKVLSPATGLVGSPERIDENDRKKKGIKGWKITSLLMPTIQIGNPVFIESKDIDNGSKFKVVDITHQGDTHEGDWVTSLQVQDI